MYNPRLYIYYLNGRFSRELDCESYIGCWIEEGDSFLFFLEKQDKLVSSIVEDEKNLSLKDKFEMEYIEWLGGEIDTFDVGDVRIIPIWNRPSKLNNRDILLDPSVVFGAGNHETTYNSLLAIDWLFKNNTIESVLDLGCGTGILSLFCVKLGAKIALSVDLNPLAVRTTRKNILLNNMNKKILPIWGRAQDFVQIKSNLLVANIHFDVLSDILTEIKVNNFNWLILSGMFPSKVEEINSLLWDKGFKIHKIFGGNTNWPTIVGGHNI